VPVTGQSEIAETVRVVFSGSIVRLWLPHEHHSRAFSEWPSHARSRAALIKCPEGGCSPGVGHRPDDGSRTSRDLFASGPRKLQPACRNASSAQAVVGNRCPLLSSARRIRELCSLTWDLEFPASSPENRRRPEAYSRKRLLQWHGRKYTCESWQIGAGFCRQRRSRRDRRSLS
jgi:hypothetical protein